jgi:hypothetical protein
MLKTVVLLAVVAASTTVVHYSPKNMKAQKMLDGSCWTSSIASPRADAYRCMAGNEIYDPCFVIDPKSAGCPTDLTSDRGVVLNLTKPLPKPESPAPSPQAFAMVLQSGAACNRATGTVVADYPYYCSGESGVCQGPDLAKPQSAYFVKCGTPKDALHVTGVTSTLVKIIYE